MRDWAEPDYDCVLITDEDEPVTIKRVRENIEPKLQVGLQRIIVYFCGHGIRAAPDHYWLLSGDNSKSKNRISRDAFRDDLVAWGPRQIAIFTDACHSSMPYSGVGSWVIEKEPPIGRLPKTRVESFYSTQDWAPSYAVGNDGRDGKCIFTSCVHDALTFTNPGAIDEFVSYAGMERLDLVTGRSLHEHLEIVVPRAVAAEARGRYQEPRFELGFRRPNDIYSMRSSETQSPIAASFTDNRPYEVEIWADGTRKVPEEPPVNFDTASLLKKTSSEWRNDIVEEAFRFTQSDDGRIQHLIVGSDGAVDVYGDRLQREQRLGPSVYGPSISTFDADPSDGLAASERSSTYIVRLGSGIEQLVMPVVVYDSLYCTLTHSRYAKIDGSLQNDADEGATLGYGPQFLRPEDGRELQESTLATSGLEFVRGPGAINALANGDLSSADRFLMAAAVRRMKHEDPMLGVVAAYLYDAIGDVDNVRRMCWFYSQKGQDIPFDIAMLADVPFIYQEGILIAEIPAVEHAATNDSFAELPDYVTCATDEVSCGIAGRMPILRGGWNRLRHLRFELNAGLFELSGELTAASLTTFSGVEVLHKLRSLLRRYS